MFFTLDRYILREFFRIFLLSLLAMMAFYEMVTFIDMAGYFFKFKAPPTVIGRYMLYKIPMALFHVTPICVLLASVLTMAQFSRTSELVAMKVAGMGLWRVAAPVIAASGAVSGLAFLDSEYLFHLAARETNRILYEEIKHQERNTVFSRDRFWYMADDGAIWYLGAVDLKGRRLRDVSIFATNGDGSVRARYTADGAELVNNQWVFTNLTQRKFAASGRFTEQRWDKAPLDGRLVALEDLGRARLDPEEMNLEQIREYIRDIRAKGYDTAVYVADMHAKIAFPLITLVMPLLAIPLGARSSRSGGMLAGIVVAVVIGVTFWFMFSMSVAFGRAGRLPPEVAAYGAHVVFGLTGLWMLVTDRR